MTEKSAFRAELPAYSEIDTLLGKLAREYLVPGAQLAARIGGRTHTFVHGETVHGSGQPVTAETLFPLGSTTKSVTATLLLQLVSDGDLELDEPVGPSLPELDAASGALYSATPRQLLSHTAGLPDMPDTEANPSLRDCVTASARAEPLCVPGRVFSYSNLGYVLAGRVLEAVSGMSWWEAARTFVLNPLGVEPGFLGAPTAPRPVTGQHAVHLPTSTVTALDEPGLPKALVPAGALLTSAADLIRLTAPHLGADGPEILEPALLEQMRRSVPGSAVPGLADGWGLGLAAFHDGAGHLWWGHDGNTGGASCTLRFDAEHGVAVALMTNATSGRQMAARLLTELAALGPDIGRAGIRESEGEGPGHPLTGEVLRHAADEVCGTYRSGSDTVVVRRDAAHGLLLDRPGLVPARMDLHAGLVFRLRPLHATADGHVSDESKDLYCFVRDTVTDRVGGMYLSGGRLQVREGTGPLA